MIELKVWKEDADNKILTYCEGYIGDVLEELSRGTAHMLIDLLDNTPGVMKDYDGLARMYSLKVGSEVNRILSVREGKADERRQEPDGGAAH